MSVVSAVAAAVLGVVFVVAGASKMAAGATWHHQAGDLGAPAWLARVLPWIEVLVGASLVAQLAEPVPAVLAIVMLVGFSAAIARRLAEGRRPACACFGAWSASPIGPGHLARNGGFVVLGLLALYP